MDGFIADIWVFLRCHVALCGLDCGYSKCHKSDRFLENNFCWSQKTPKVQFNCLLDWIIFVCYRVVYVYLTVSLFVAAAIKLNDIKIEDWMKGRMVGWLDQHRTCMVAWVNSGRLSFLFLFLCTYIEHYCLFTFHFERNKEK